MKDMINLFIVVWQYYSPVICTKSNFRWALTQLCECDFDRYPYYPLSWVISLIWITTTFETTEQPSTIAAPKGSTSPVLNYFWCTETSHLLKTSSRALIYYNPACYSRNEEHITRHQLHQSKLLCALSTNPHSVISLSHKGKLIGMNSAYMSLVNYFTILETSTSWFSLREWMPLYHLEIYDCY